jgi:AcrR family transcriptional regulator
MTRMPVAERRRQLIAAALSVAAESGIEAATVRRVTAEAGVAPGIFHYCFGSKDELLAAMAEAIVEESSAAARAALKPGKDLESALRAGLRGLWRVIEATPGTQLLTYELTSYALREPGMEGAAIRQYDGSRAAASEFLSEVATGAGVRWTRPVGHLARMVLAMLDGVTLAWLVDRDSKAALATLDTFAGQLAMHAAPRDSAGDSRASK